MKLTDYTNGLINVADTFGWKIRSIYFKFIMRYLCLLQGVKLGSGCTFYGKTKFKRSRTGSIKIGDNCSFRSSHTSNLIGVNRPCIVTSLANDANLTIGNNCGFSGTVIGCFDKINIGNAVLCGANTLITDSDWHLDDPRSGKPKSITIGDCVWLGEGVKVLKGVSIGENSVIGAGSVVSKDIPANVIAAGNPCRIIKELK
mgnify:CR=1 FL=1